MFHVRSRRVLATTTALVVIATLGVACTSGDPASHNAADVTFSADMIPHHRQAVEMAQMVPSRSTDPEVITLAGQIESGQQPEIDELTARLREWDEPVPSGAMDHESMGHSSMAGMMGEADMAELRTLSGPAFDKRWLTMMIEHHTGAVAMSRTEIEQGLDAESIALARSIIDAQQAELTRMRTMLAS